MIELRARRAEDVPYVRAWTADPDTTRWLLAPYGFKGYELDPPSFAAAAFTVVAGDTPIGTAGLMAASPEHRHAKAFLVIGDAAYRGRGYGEATMRALLAFAFDDMNLAKVELEVVADNTRAVALYERLGFVREVHRRGSLWNHGAWRDEYLMGLLREEWS